MADRVTRTTEQSRRSQREADIHTSVRWHLEVRGLARPSTNQPLNLKAMQGRLEAMLIACEETVPKGVAFVRA